MAPLNKTSSTKGEMTPMVKITNKGLTSPREVKTLCCFTGMVLINSGKIYPKRKLTKIAQPTANITINIRSIFLKPVNQPVFFKDLRLKSRTNIIKPILVINKV